MKIRTRRGANRNQPFIAVVIPAYQAAESIQTTLRGFLPLADLVVVVDDASTDQTSRKVADLNERKIVLLRHDVNRGVGGATKTGIRAALERGAEIVVKVDADGQMDPAWFGVLLAPLLENRADVAKGNRWHDRVALLRMPLARRIGNLGLGFLTRVASGHWHVFDPNNGYIAWRSELLKKVDLDRVPDRFTFESGMLVQIALCGGAVEDVAIPARYGDETSHLSVSSAPFRFFPYLAGAFLRRLWRQYFVLDFNAVSLFLVAGVPMVAFGAVFGAYHWARSIETGHPATAGTVIVAALPVLLGIIFLLQAMVLDIGQARRRKISSDLDLRPRRRRGRRRRRVD